MSLEVTKKKLGNHNASFPQLVLCVVQRLGNGVVLPGPDLSLLYITYHDLGVYCREDIVMVKQVLFYILHDTLQFTSIDECMDLSCLSITMLLVVQMGKQIEVKGEGRPAEPALT